MSELTSIGRTMRWIGLFWMMFAYVTLAVNTGIAFTKHPSLLRSSTGFWFTATVLSFACVYALLSRAFVVRLKGEARYWELHSVVWRIACWTLLLALNLLLLRYDATFAYMLWTLFGCAFNLLKIPWAFIAAMIPVGIMFYSWGVLPLSNTLGAWLGFMGIILAFIAYGGIMAMIYGLIHQRYQREHLFQELHKAHEQLRQAHTQLAASAEHERELAVLRERGRLSREMHDTLGHALVLTTVKLEAVRRLMTVNPERADHEIVVTQDIVRHAMTELRTTLAELRSPLTSCEPFTKTLAGHAQAIGERTGMQVTCTIAPTASAWPPTLQAALLRIGTEAMNNVEHHAQARQMTMQVNTDGDQAVMHISDDGVGLPRLPTADYGGVTSPDGHFGLAGMRERVTALDGTITITSTPQHGTSIAVRLPLAITAKAALGMPIA